MKLEIEIPDKDYDKMCKGELIDTILVAIKNGTPIHDNIRSEEKGKWIDFGLADKYGTHEYKCSKCKNSVYDKEGNIKYHKYCLHCGNRNEVE